MCLPNFMKFRHSLFKILKIQNVADGSTDKRMDYHTDVKTVYPHPQQTHFAGSINKYIVLSGTSTIHLMFQN